MTPSRGLVRVLLLLTGAASPGCQGDTLVEPSLGTIQITTLTTGADPDTDGYTVQVDAEPPRAVGPAAILYLSDVAGHHNVQLAGLATNCAVEGENPRPADVPANDTTRVEFVVRCSSTGGSILVAASTSGSFPDPDGYAIEVDGILKGKIGAEGKQSVAELPTGEHRVELQEVAWNCAVRGTPSVVVTVSAGATDTVAFSVDCALPPPIAFGSEGQIFLVNPDGSGLHRIITPQDQYFFNPQWSPDGSRILANTFLDPWVMNSDGTGPVRLTSGTEALYEAHWSPDGTRIAFVRDTVGLTPSGAPDSSCDYVCRVPQIWVVGADGTNPKPLALGWGISWSPHSLRIAFSNGNHFKTGQICVINADGSGFTQLTNLPYGAGGAQWSPAGGRIAFGAYLDLNYPSPARAPWRDIFLIDPSGSNLLNLTHGRADYEDPQWSPDGGRIAFVTYADVEEYNAEIGLMNTDGSGETNLTRALGFDFDPHWSPDGNEILFARNSEYPNGGSTEAYVMRSDGSNQIDVSGRSVLGLSWSSHH
jgi:Tol biopolymer transport system component